MSAKQTHRKSAIIKVTKVLTDFGWNHARAVSI